MQAERKQISVIRFAVFDQFPYTGPAPPHPTNHTTHAHHVYSGGLFGDGVP